MLIDQIYDLAGKESVGGAWECYSWLGEWTYRWSERLEILLRSADEFETGQSSIKSSTQTGGLTVAPNRAPFWQLTVFHVLCGGLYVCLTFQVITVIPYWNPHAA